MDIYKTFSINNDRRIYPLERKLKMSSLHELACSREKLRVLFLIHRVFLNLDGSLSFLFPLDVDTFPSRLRTARRGRRESVCPIRTVTGRGSAGRLQVRKPYNRIGLAASLSNYTILNYVWVGSFRFHVV